MLPYLFHIYGPIYANSYGIAIAIAIMIFGYCIDQDPRRARFINSEQLNYLIIWSTLVGILGGRLLWIASNLPLSFYEMLEIWEGGFAVLGSLIAILIFVPIYLHQKKLVVWPLLDLAAIYAPLLQSIARIGCFLAGCCYGIPTDLFWGVVYTHPDVAVPTELQCIPIHPTQLYSSLLLFIIFLLMRYVFSKYMVKTGQLTAIYLMLASAERFLVDFWRADQEFFELVYLQFLSLHQWIALCIFICATLLLIHQSNPSKIKKFVE